MIGGAHGIASDLRGAADAVLARGGELGRPIHWVERTTSTNDLARQAARAGAPHGSAWVAEEQSDGRGRQGRAWIAPRGESLLFSVLLRIDCDPRSLPPISVAAGLAVTEAVALHVVEPRPALKWPNDVLIGDRKVAGVLVEATATGPGSHDVVVGIGINVHTRVFPAELAARATSIANHVSRAPVRAELLADVLERLDRDLAIVVGRGLGPLASRLAACDGLGGKPVRCAEGLEGIAEGIDERGRLLVRGPDGALARWSSGEVHIVRRSAPSPCF